MKVSEVANNIIQTANSDQLKGLQTLKTVCNSDSAFVAAVKKYQAYQKLLQKAFLLSRTWQKFGQARTWKITVKALIETSVIHDITTKWPASSKRQ